MATIFLHDVNDITLKHEWKRDANNGVYRLTTIHTPEADLHLFSSTKPVDVDATDLNSAWHGHPMESGHFWILVTNGKRRLFNSLDELTQAFRIWGGDIYSFDFDDGFRVDMENYNG